MHALHRTTARHAAGSVPLLLAYDTTDPFAVSAVFGREPWLFSRELLIEGVTSPAGIGDVHVAPDGEEVSLTVRGESRELTLHVPASDINEFLAATLSLVPAGDEDVPVEDWLAAMGLTRS